MKNASFMAKLAAVGLAVGGWGAGPAAAAILMYSAVVDNDGAYFESGTGGDFTLSQFNSSLGTLQSVVLTLTAAAHGGSIWVDNEWTAAGKVQLELGTSVTLWTPEYAQLDFAPSSATPLSALAADEAGDGSGTDFTGADSLQFNAGAVSETQTYVPSDLSLYLGSGLLTYSFWGESFSSILALSPLDTAGRLTDSTVLSAYGLTASIAYTYAPASSGGGDSGGGDSGGGDAGGGGNVPEPGTLSMGLVLAGCALARWRKSRRRERQETLSEMPSV